MMSLRHNDRGDVLEIWLPLLDLPNPRKVFKTNERGVVYFSNLLFCIRDENFDKGNLLKQKATRTDER